VRITIKREVEVELDIDTIATVFAELPAREQAQFFCKVAEVMATWKGGRVTQSYAIGENLRAAPFEARQVVLDIAAAIEDKP
jgi:hypothetical protein